MSQEPVRELDVREIDGEPFGDIMSSLSDLPEGATLQLLADFEPVPLYDVLEQRGFTCETEEADGVYRLTIRHA